MTLDKKSGIQSAGDVDIENLVIISAGNTILDVKDYLVELNIYEDIFSNALYGTIQLSDSRNLLKELPIIGNETLVIKARTPTFSQAIDKQFRIYSITDRVIVKDQNTQLYTLHFCSQEVIKDSVQPLYRSFSGKIDSVVQNIFKDYLTVPRTYSVTPNDAKLISDPTSLKTLTLTENSVKFVSPGWTPLKCINWLMSKAIPSSGKACTFLFWETIHGFYFGTIETIFGANTDSNIGNMGKYSYSPKHISGGTDTIEDQFFLVQDLEIVKTSDHLQNFSSGYLANRLITLDVINKKYELVDYDHVSNFSSYRHTSSEALPIFIRDTPRDPGTSVRFYPVNPGLHDLKNNVNERMSQIYGNRLSNMMELNNFKLNLTVPGRTDAEAGSMIYFSFPDVAPNDETDLSKTNEDQYYSGNYIVTAIRHKINPLRHTMTMEIVKDSLSNKRNQ